MTDHAQPSEQRAIEVAYEGAHFAAHEMAERLLESIDRLPTLDDAERPIHSGHVACLEGVVALLTRTHQLLAQEASGRLAGPHGQAVTNTPNDHDLDSLLAAIAHKHLSIRTLATRGNDARDLHQVAVWSVREALRAAYEAGREAGQK